MDLLTHALAGFAGGTLVASFTKRPFAKKISISFMGMLGGMLPDIDAISLWSRFDSTFGRLFGLQNSGKVIYSAKFWYSHHAFFHSIFAAILLTLLGGLLVYGILKIRKKVSSAFLQSYFPYGLAFLFGYLLHLVCDMPTPASAWGGVNLLWPSKSYIGGFAKIWWWNNYDIFLIILTFCVIGVVLLATIKKAQKTISALFLFACIFIIVQINCRKEDYSDNLPFNTREEASKKEQLRILGPKMFSLMEKFDSKLIIYF